MGNALSDNQEVERQSGFGRICNSILCAVLVAPLVLIGACILLGWNEKRAVCEGKAINMGRDKVQQVDCSSRTWGDGNLVMFSCDLQKDGLSPWSVPNSDFQSVMSYVGTGLNVQAEMFQCVETVSSDTKKDSLGGGTTTTKTYTYKKDWRPYYVDSSAFAKKVSDNYVQNCGVDNPPWPAGLPQSTVQYAPQVKAGPFNLDAEYIRKVPLNTPVIASSVPAGWKQQGGEYTSTKWEVASSGAGAGIGQVRVSFKGTNWNRPTVTVLGQNSRGMIERWTAKSSWLCSGFTLGDLREGVVPKDEFFEDLQGRNRASTWILRVVGFCLAWFAFSRLAEPLGVAADCVPCIGPYLGGIVELVACAIAFFPAAGCTLGVIGVVWIAMRPMVGSILLVIFILLIAATVHFRQTRTEKEQTYDDPEPAPYNHDAVGAGFAPPPYGGGATGLPPPPYQADFGAGPQPPATYGPPPPGAGPLPPAMDGAGNQLDPHRAPAPIARIPAGAPLPPAAAAPSYEPEPALPPPVARA